MHAAYAADAGRLSWQTSTQDEQDHLSRRGGLAHLSDLDRTRRMPAHVPDLVEGQHQDVQAEDDEIRQRRYGRDVQDPWRYHKPRAENDIGPFLPDTESCQRHRLG